MPDRDKPSATGSPTAERVPPLSIVALDDDADFREFVTDLLRKDGHEVRAASGPDELYAAIEQSQPEVVLLDMKMGRHSGEAVLAELRQRWAKLCVIVVTGYPSFETMRQTFKQDVFDYLAKPFSPDEMRRVLRQAAEQHNLGGGVQQRLRNELGRQIRLSRAAKGWTLKDLSEASDVSVSQLSSIERGAHLPSMESFLSVAIALNAQPSDWLKAAGF
jgi:DNA-binding NtrC family response regulator